MPFEKQLDSHDAQVDPFVDGPPSPRADTGRRIADIPFSFPRRRGLKRVVVPLMLFASSVVMALAWLGHLRFTESPFIQAMFACWLLVLPEYFLNISAIRLGYHVYSGAVMAAFNLCSGVVCVAFVSVWVLGETLTLRQLIGFALMIVAMGLISVRHHGRFVDEELDSVDDEEAADTRRPSDSTGNELPGHEDMR